MKYLQDNDRISRGHLSNISGTTYTYLRDVQISPGHGSNIYRTPINISRTKIKYLQDTEEISPGHSSNI